MFAVCLITLLLLTALDKPLPPTATEPIVLARDLRAIRRAPLAAVDTIEFLRARRLAAPGASLDVSSELRLTRDGATRAVSVDAIADLGSDSPVRLYVFGHDNYASVARRLEAARIVWTEVSVPAALRRQAGSADWSPGFLALLERAEDPGRFREGLSRLLAGGGMAEGLPAGSIGASDERGPMAGWRSAARAGFEWMMLILAVLVLLGIERRRGRKRAPGALSGDRGLL